MRVIAKFDMNGMSSKIPLIKFYYLEIESKIEEWSKFNIFIFFVYFKNFKSIKK